MPATVFIGLIFGCIGAVLMGIGLSRRRVTSDWIEAQGRIVACSSGLQTTSPYPRFEWRDEEGEKHVHESSFGSWRHYRKGDPVVVRYDPNQPRHAVISSAVQRGASFFWLGVLLVGVSGAFLAIELLFE